MTGGNVRARLAWVFSAQIYNQVATMGVQLLLVPLLLHAWGTERYGVWLLLSAIPTYLTLSDFGFTFIAKNEMVMQVAANRRDHARRTFQSVFAMLSMAAPILLASVLAAVWLIDPTRLFSLAGVPVREAREALSLLLLNVVGYQFALLVSAGIRSENRPAAEAVWAASSRIAEGVSIAAAALAGGSLAAAALSAVLARTTFAALSYGWMRRNTRWLSLGYAAAEWGEIKRLFRPAIGYMLLPVSQAFLIQGPVLVLGAISGPLQVVIFSTSRTLARVGTAATNMLNNTLVTEYSARAGTGDSSGFARLFRTQMGWSIVVVGAYCAGVLLLSYPLMRLFTHGEVDVVQPFFLILVMAVAAEMLWTAMFTPISAINRHVSVTNWFFCISISGFALCWLLALKLGLTGTSLALVAVHGSMILVCSLIGRAGRIGAPVVDVIGQPIVEIGLDPGPAGENEVHAV